MAAIRPHLAEDHQTTAVEESYWNCATGEGLSDADPLCATPQTVLDQSHAHLLDVAMVRKIVIEQMQGRRIRLNMRGKDIVLTIDEAVQGPVWNPMTNENIKSTALLSWTTKMGAPSFSLPAGASPLGGSCPGANAGQSVVPDSIRRKAAKTLLPVLKAPRVELAKAICEFCYAEGGQYGTSSVQFHQLMRFAWVRQAIQVDMEGNRTSDVSQSEFVLVMIEAIERANFKRDLEPEHWRDQRFFRIHDSGDFFSLTYLRAWKAIANHFHPSKHSDPIMFWAPTRIWAVGERIVREVNQINGQSDTNLILRPSAYHIDQHGPEGLGPGWASPSVVYPHDTKHAAEGRTFDWDCKAYAAKDGPSCRGAESPNGQTGCRACWKKPEMRINYTLH